jgi:hypothetical protein
MGGLFYNVYCFPILSSPIAEELAHFAAEFHELLEETSSS